MRSWPKELTHRFQDVRKIQSDLFFAGRQEDAQALQDFAEEYVRINAEYIKWSELYMGLAKDHPRILKEQEERQDAWRRRRTGKVIDDRQTG